MLRFYIVAPDGRFFRQWRINAENCLDGIVWTFELHVAQSYRLPRLAQGLLEQVQAFEPEARLVEQETEDL